MSDVRICKNGHEMPEDNIFWHKNTNGKIYGSCLICRRSAKRRSYRKHCPIVKIVGGGLGTYCTRGHLKTEESTYQQYKDGKKDGLKCRICQKENLKRNKVDKRYGITLKEYDNLLEQQGGKCAICELENPFNRDFHIDHCHITKKVRGILCATCNTALGHAKDSPELLRKMADYIEQHR
jgi:hypothetical protein